MEPIVLIGAVCLGGIVLILFFSIFAGFLNFIFSIFGFVLDILFGGPVAWCACLVVLVLLGACGIVTATALLNTLSPT